MWEFKKPKKQDKTSLWAMLGIGAASLVAAVLLSEKLAPRPEPKRMSPFGGKQPLNLKKLMLIGASVVAIMLLVDLTDLSRYYKTSLFEPEEQETIEEVGNAQLGKPYKLGATGPDAFDCSGFTQYVMKQVGVDLPRTSRDQGTVGKEIDLDDAGVGDLVFFYTNSSAPNQISHVGILINKKNGDFINANSWLQKITIDNLNAEYWRTRLAGIREIQIPGRTGKKQKVNLKPVEELDQTEPSWGEDLPPSEKADTRLEDSGDTKVAAEVEEVTTELSEQHLSQVEDETTVNETEIEVEDTTPSTPDFPDVSPDHPRYTEIKYLQTEGIVKGYSDGTFRPESTVTRAELLKIVMNAKGISVRGEADLNDIKGHWVEPYVATAQKLKIISGYPDGTFKPDAKVSMVEAFKIILNTMHVTIANDVDSLPFQNIELDAWYAPYVAKIYEANLLDLPGNELNPDTKILRQDVATLIYRIEMLGSSGLPEQA